MALWLRSNTYVGKGVLTFAQPTKTNLTCTGRAIDSYIKLPIKHGVMFYSQVMGVVLFNISLRMLHTTKQPALGRPFVTGLQYVLRETPVGSLFFGSVAKVKNLAVSIAPCFVRLGK